MLTFIFIYAAYNVLVYNNNMVFIHNITQQTTKALFCGLDPQCGDRFSKLRHV